MSLGEPSPDPTQDIACYVMLEAKASPPFEADYRGRR
jgi:hypothetical protein